MKKNLTSEKIKANILDNISNLTEAKYFTMTQNSCCIDTSNSDILIKCKYTHDYNIFEDECNLCFVFDEVDINYKNDGTYVFINNDKFNLGNIDDIKNKLCEIMGVSTLKDVHVKNILDEINIVEDDINMSHNKKNITQNIDKDIEDIHNEISTSSKKLKKLSTKQKLVESLEKEINELKEQIKENNKTTEKKHKFSYNIDTVRQKIADAKTKLEEDPDNENLIALINKNNFLVRDYDQYMEKNKNIFEVDNKNTELIKKLKEHEDTKNKTETEIEKLNELQNNISKKENKLKELNEKIDNINNLDFDKLQKKLDKLNLTLKKINKKMFLHDIIDDIIQNIFTIDTNKKNIKDVDIKFIYL